MIGKLLAFVLPLGLDSFAVAAAIGASAVTAWRDRLRITVVFVIFEAGMPLIGLALGAALARGIGHAAGYVSAAAVIAIGAWMLTSGQRGDDDDAAASRLAASHGLALAALGLSISLDELAIGFSLGLARLPVIAVITAIAVQALLAAQLGLALGAKISERLRERAEQIAGTALVLLGGFLVYEQIHR